MTQTVVVATFNSEKTLGATLDSLLFQTYKNFEIIIIDGLSKDATINIIKFYEHKFLKADISYTWFSEQDSGIYDAWNKALKKANSPWIAFLGSDDTYYPFAIETYANKIAENHNINYISSKVEVTNAKNMVLKIIGQPFNYNQMSRYMNIGHVGSFHHIDLFNKFGNFDTAYKIAGDYEFFLRCGHYINAIFVNKITVSMLNIGVSNKYIGKVFKENLQLHLKYKRLSALQSYLEFYLAHFKRFKRHVFK